MQTAFRVALFWGILIPLAFLPSAADEPPQNREVARLSASQWRQLVNATRVALVGNEELPPAMSENPTDAEILAVPPEDRENTLKNWLGPWLASESFADRQTRLWIRDRLSRRPIAAAQQQLPRLSEGPWKLHDRWLQSAIQRDLSYLRFVQLQLAGDRLGASSDQVATASWLRPDSGIPAQGVPEQGVAGRGTHSGPLRIEAGEVSQELPATLQRLRDPLGAGWVWELDAAPERVLQDLEAAMLSIAKSDLAERKRLQVENEVARWQRQQPGFPSPPMGDIVFHYPNPASAIQALDDPETRVRTPNAYPLGPMGEWSVVVELEVRPPLDTKNSIPQPVAKPSASGDTSGAAVGNDCLLALEDRPLHSAGPLHCAGREWRIEWVQGRVRVVIADRSPGERVAVESESPLPLGTQPGHRLAVAFDGLSTAASIRIGWDGQQVKTKVLYDRWNPSSRESLPLDWVAGPVAIPGGTLAPVEWTCYRTALTDLEILGLDPPPEWKDWDEESEPQQRWWREHYARRIDPELRYLRESLLFYASNYFEKWRGVPTTPTIASEPWLLAWLAARMVGDTDMVGETEEFPRGLGDAAWEAAWWDPTAEARLRLAEACGSHLAPSVAMVEVRRQWRCLTEAHPDAAELSEERIQSISSDWIEHRWSRSWLLSVLLGSTEWQSIAIDSHR